MDPLLDDIKDMVLASIQTQIAELEDKLKAMTNATAYKDRITLESSIKGKKAYMYRIRFTGDFFSLLDPEHIRIIRMFLGDRNANGTL